MQREARFLCVVGCDEERETPAEYAGAGSAPASSTRRPIARTAPSACARYNELSKSLLPPQNRVTVPHSVSATAWLRDVGYVITREMAIFLGRTSAQHARRGTTSEGIRFGGSRAVRSTRLVVVGLLQREDRATNEIAKPPSRRRNEEVHVPTFRFRGAHA